MSETWFWILMGLIGAWAVAGLVFVVYTAGPGRDRPLKERP